MIAASLLVLVLVVLTIPIAFAIFLGSFWGLQAQDLPSYIVAQRIFGQLTSSAFLAIPFFVLAGDLMERGGVATRLVGLIRSAIGHVRGGLPLGSVALSLGFAGISGSAVADAAFESRVLVPEMRAEGYDGPWAAALTAASAAVGPIFPPSVIMIIYAALTAIPVGPLFMGGVVPALMLTAAFMITVAWQCRRRPKGKWVGRRASLRALRDALWALIAPAIILVGIVWGVFTATEAGAVVVLYVLFLTVCIYRSLSVRDFIASLKQSAITSGAVMLIVAAASVLAWLLGFIGLGNQIGEWLGALPSGTAVVAVTILALLVLGTFIDENAMGILLIPVLHPIVVDLGVDPVHFAVLMVLAVLAGSISPPVGILLFVTSAATGEPLEKMSWKIIPFNIAMVAVIALCVVFPPFVTWLPNQVFG